MIKEIATAKNIKNRVNQQLVSRLLRVIQDFFIRVADIPENGIIVYAGIDEYEKEIFETFIPIIKLNQFYYNCSKHFIIDRFLNLFNNINGHIIFANGENCYIYKFENTFIKIKSINANLIKRHNKGGSSSARFGRLAEESRQSYVMHVISYINELCRDSNCWIFGSGEIVKMILDRNELLVKLNNGGFLDFNNDTINDTNKWLTYLSNEKLDDNILEEIVLYLDTNPNMLDFDIHNAGDMKFFIEKDDIEKYRNSKYYYRVRLFEYIGVKYFDYDIDIDNEITI